MNRKLCIQGVGLVIIALVLLTAAAGAAPAAKPTPAPSPTEQILAIVTDIQQTVNTLLTRISALQTTSESISTDVTTMKGDVAAIKTSSAGISTDVTTMKGDVATIKTSSESISTDVTSLKGDVAAIQTTADAINAKVSELPEPIRYEYYTTVVPSHLFDGMSDSSINYWIGFSNAGDTEAHIVCTLYDATLIGDGSAMTQIGSPYQLTIGAKHSKSFKYIANENPPGSELKFPIVTVKITSDSPYVAPRLVILNNVGSPIDKYLPGDFQKVEIYH